MASRCLVILSLILSCGRAARAAGPSPGADVHPGLPQVEFINQQLTAAWASDGVRPASDATDGEWCRRVHLDLIGRIPKLEELKAFLADKSPSKRADLVARLLGEEYEDEYSRHWTDVWTTMLIGRDATNDLVNRSGMRQYLRRAFSKNIPYDRLMEELVTATGVNANRKDLDGFNGATNFLSGKLGEMGDDKGLEATAKTARIFLGLQVQCTQCHDHPLPPNQGKQNQFWELNAFFRQARALRRRGGTDDVQWIELVDEDFVGDQNDPEEAEIYYELRNGQKRVAYPVFVDGTAIPRSGFLPGTMEDGTRYGVNRRRELATLIRTSPLFPKAAVNRMWGHFLGHGFTRPVDDLGEHNPPSHPELLDGLAERFRDGGFDLKELARWIVLSRPYATSSRPSASGPDDDPASGEKPKFARFYLRQMQAEELYESLLTATEADRAARAEDAAKKKDEWLSQFVIAFGTDEGDEATTFNGSIPQVLTMFNGDLIENAVAIGKGGFLHRVAAAPLNSTARIETLYLAALARKPSRTELDVAKRLVAARKGDAIGALQDVWWAVLNSNEFIFQH